MLNKYKVELGNEAELFSDSINLEEFLDLTFKGFLDLTFKGFLDGDNA